MPLFGGAGHFACSPVSPHPPLCLMSPSPEAHNFNFAKESPSICRDGASGGMGRPRLNGVREEPTWSVHSLSIFSLFLVLCLILLSMLHGTSDTQAFLGLVVWNSFLLVSIPGLMFLPFLFLYSYFSGICESSTDK